MKNFLFGLLTAFFIGFIIFVSYQFGKKTVKSNTPTSPTAPITSEPTPSNKLGGDRDAHGCIPSAGYSWCESKKKCLRNWEEGCPSEDDGELIKQALFKKNNWKESDGITVTVSTNDGKYASGTVTAQGGGGYFYAAKIGDNWEIVADGNGMIMCSSLEKYPDYPKTLIPQCYDQSSEKSVQR